MKFQRKPLLHYFRDILKSSKFILSSYCQGQKKPLLLLFVIERSIFLFQNRSLRSQPVKKTCGEIFKHPDVAIVSVEEVRIFESGNKKTKSLSQIFNEMIRTVSMETLERRLSDTYEEAIARLSLFEMRQAWASSKLFNDRPFRPRRLSSCPAPGPSRLVTQQRRRRSSNFTVMVTSQNHFLS